MAIFREIPPTAGFPIYLRDFFKIKNNTTDNLSLFETNFKNYLGVSYAKITCSGTLALYLIIETIKQLSNKKTVIIPSYICPLVPLAIARSGLKVAVSDINNNNFDYNIETLEALCAKNKDVFAIIINHLAGIPSDFFSLKQIAKKYGLLIIEDCAQSLGAVYKNNKVGTLGDFSFFSFCRGKGVTIYEGGMVVTNNKEYADLLDRNNNILVKTNIKEEYLKIFELFGYSLFYRPYLFWWVFKLPSIFWKLRGQPLRACIEDFTIDFPVHRVSKFRANLGNVLFSHLEENIIKQRQKAYFYLENLNSLPGIKCIKEQELDKASYPYLTILFEDKNKRDKILKSLDQFGLGGSQIYALDIGSYEYLKDIVEKETNQNAKLMARNSLTLSTSIFLKDNDLKKIVKIIKDI